LAECRAWGTDAGFLEIFQRRALAPAQWQPRTGFGREFDRFIGYFVITTFVCLAWPRPLAIGATLMVFGSALEGLQAFTPDLAHIPTVDYKKDRFAARSRLL